ncbi:MAG: hypothetical protein ACRCZO_05165, partial [Cetobacterium sp.]
KVHVLKKALAELNGFERQYKYDFEEIKIARRVHKIKFIKSEKNLIDISENLISEKLEKAILKARKNRFVDEVYSACVLQLCLAAL